VHVALAVTALAALVVQPASGLLRFEAVEPHMGTLVRITVYTPDEHSARRAFRAAFDRIHALETILSDYQTDSELNRVTREAVGRPVPVSPDLFAVLDAAQALARATGGAFDITQGPVVRLWRDARTTGRRPDEQALEEAARRSGHTRLALDADRRTVMFDTAGMALDVGGIAKGYAASEAVEVLRSQGVASALVAVSGDLAFSDAPPGRAGWRIQVDAAGAPGIPEVLELTNAAVSTSGMSAQHVEIDGTRYSHIIDPSSRAGLHDDLTVVVISRRGMDADALATAVSVLGDVRGLRLVESHADAAALIVRRAGSRAEVVASSRFPRFTS
jgi:FAD:protein FMN transferase